MVRWREGGVQFDLAGSPSIWVHPAVPVVPVVLTFHLWAFGEVVDRAAAAIIVPAFILSTLGHELGHAAVARRWGLRTDAIRLLPTGGVAELRGRPESLTADRQITLAGPAVNLLIGIACLGAAAAEMAALPIDRNDLWFNPLPMPPTPVLQALVWTGWVNLALAFFNMLPAVPLDGGQIAYGLLAPRLGVPRTLFWIGLTGVLLGLATGFLSLVSLLAGVPVLLPPSVGENWRVMRRGSARAPAGRRSQ